MGTNTRPSPLNRASAILGEVALAVAEYRVEIGEDIARVRLDLERGQARVEEARDDLLSLAEGRRGDAVDGATMEATHSMAHHLGRVETAVAMLEQLGEQEAFLGHLYDVMGLKAQVCEEEKA